MSLVLAPYGGHKKDQRTQPYPSQHDVLLEQALPTVMSDVDFHRDFVRFDPRIFGHRELGENWHSDKLCCLVPVVPTVHHFLRLQGQRKLEDQTRLSSGESAAGSVCVNLPIPQSENVPVGNFVGKIFFAGGGGNPDNVRDTLTQTMSQLDYFLAGVGGWGNPDNLSEIPLTRTMSQMEIFFCRGGGVTQTICPRYP